MLLYEIYDHCLENDDFMAFESFMQLVIVSYGELPSPPAADHVWCKKIRFALMWIATNTFKTEFLMLQYLK